MKKVLLLICIAFLSVSCRHDASAQEKALLLISRFGEAWEDSSRSFADISHLACMKIAAVENTSNRLECALAYQNAVLGLPKYLRECDEDGFWARLNAQTAIERIITEIDTISRWRFTAEWWRSIHEEIRYYDTHGSSAPMRLVGGVADLDTMRKATAKVDGENKIRKVALERRHYANRLRGCIRTMYRPIFEYALKEEWNKVPVERRDELMHMIRDVVGKCPEWYEREMRHKCRTDKCNLQP